MVETKRPVDLRLVLHAVASAEVHDGVSGGTCLVCGQACPCDTAVLRCEVEYLHKLVGNIAQVPVAGLPHHLGEDGACVWCAITDEATAIVAAKRAAESEKTITLTLTKADAMNLLDAVEDGVGSKSHYVEWLRKAIADAE